MHPKAVSALRVLLVLIYIVDSIVTTAVVLATLHTKFFFERQWYRLVIGYQRARGRVLRRRLKRARRKLAELDGGRGEI